MADLVDNFPIALGEVHRVVFSRPDWHTAPRRVRVGRRLIKVGFYPREEDHQVWLWMCTRCMIRLAVAAPRALHDLGKPTGLAARSHSVVGVDSDGDEMNAESHWNDHRGSWWDPHPVAPSERI